MDYFKHDNYIVLELPMQIYEKVMTVKREFKNSFQMIHSTEVTIAGFSGLGLLDSSQELHVAFSILDNIVLAIKTSFLEVARFPSTNIFFFLFL